MLKRIKRAWCRLAHSGVRGLWGATYECRTCGERWENPALTGHVKQLPVPQSVVLVDAPRKVVEIKRQA